MVLVSRATIDKMAANKHEVEHAQQEGIEIIGGVTPVAVVVDANGRATALRVADFVMEGKETKIVEGTERDLPADLIVSAIGQGVDFTGLEQFNNNNGLMKADKNYRFPGKEHIFVGGDVLRPHLLTTAIGHASIAVDGIDAFLQGQGTRQASEGGRSPLRRNPQVARNRPRVQRSPRRRSGAPRSARTSCTTSKTVRRATSFRTTNCSSATSPTCRVISVT